MYEGFVAAALVSVQMNGHNKVCRIKRIDSFVPVTQTQETQTMTKRWDETEKSCFSGSRVHWQKLYHSLWANYCVLKRSQQIKDVELFSVHVLYCLRSTLHTHCMIALKLNCVPSTKFVMQNKSWLYQRFHKSQWSSVAQKLATPPVFPNYFPLLLVLIISSSQFTAQLRRAMATNLQRWDAVSNFVTIM